MISGLNSSSISMALRTAERASKTMDRVSTQIATGKKVASVKDDGAAYARAAAMKSQITQNEARQQIISWAKVAVDAGEVTHNDTTETLYKIREIIISAKALPAGTNSRQQLANEYSSLLSTLNDNWYPVGAIDSGYGIWPDGWGIQVGAADPLLNGTSVYATLGSSSSWIGTFDPAGTGVTISAANILNGTTTDLDNALANANWYADHWQSTQGQDIGASQRWLEWTQSVTESDTQRLETAIGSLTDADVGKASTELEQAQTRQSLAYQTVRNAISAYGAYANSLLSNVQGTQRSIIA